MSDTVQEEIVVVERALLVEEAISRRTIRATIEALDAHRQTKQHELLSFLVIHAVRYQKLFELNGLHPVHYDLMKKYGAPMDEFRRATDAAFPTPIGELSSEQEALG